MVSHLPLYLTLIAFEAALFLGIRALAARRGQSLANLVGRRPTLADIPIGAAMWLGWMGVSYVIDLWLPPSTSQAVASMLPAGVIDSVLWVLLSTSAGIVEELAFRGYLQRRTGIVVQAIVFGIVHGYQGLYSIIRITVYGLLFGVVAHWRKSLVPGMIAHAWTDIAAGLLRW